MADTVRIRERFTGEQGPRRRWHLFIEFTAYAHSSARNVFWRRDALVVWLEATEKAVRDLPRVRCGDVQVVRRKSASCISSGAREYKMTFWCVHSPLLGQNTRAFARSFLERLFNENLVKLRYANEWTWPPQAAREPAVVREMHEAVAEENSDA